MKILFVSKYKVWLINFILEIVVYLVSFFSVNNVLNLEIYCNKFYSIFVKWFFGLLM